MVLLLILIEDDRDELGKYLVHRYFVSVNISKIDSCVGESEKGGIIKGTYKI